MPSQSITGGKRMDYKSHLFFGAISGAAVAQVFLSPPPLQFALFCAVSAFSALLPDLDLRKSKASQILYAAAFAFILAASAWLSSAGGGGAAQFLAYSACLVALFFLLDLLLRPRHRGIMHGLLFLALLSAAALALFGQFFALAVASGYFSHLASDACIKP